MYSLVNSCIYQVSKVTGKPITSCLKVLQGKHLKKQQQTNKTPPNLVPELQQASLELQLALGVVARL